MSRLPNDVAELDARAARLLVPPDLERARGAARIGFARRGAATVVADLFQSGCAKIRLPRQAPGTWREAVLINTAGGLTDGDRLSSGVQWARGARAVVTSPAAERIYRSRHAPARIETALAVGPAATALWLPQETILFDGANLARKTEIEIDPSARMIACESLIFGRTAMGEAVRSGAVVDAWRIRNAGQLVFADTFRLSGDMESTLDRPAVGAGARALATVIYAGSDAEARVATLRDLAVEVGPTRVASSCRGPVVATRILADSGMAARLALSAVLTALMESVAEAAGARLLPRIWSC